MSSRSLSATASLGAACLLIACGGGDRGASSLAGLPEFCQEVLPRVDAYLNQFEHPAGERYGGTAVIGSIGEMSPPPSPHLRAAPFTPGAGIR